MTSSAMVPTNAAQRESIVGSALSARVWLLQRIHARPSSVAMVSLTILSAVTSDGS
ncbi:MAG: hypothetical protein HEQ11_04300 [Gemmatimonas sp.]